MLHVPKNRFRSRPAGPQAPSHLTLPLTRQTEGSIRHPPGPSTLTAPSNLPLRVLRILLQVASSRHLVSQSQGTTKVSGSGSSCSLSSL